MSIAFARSGDDPGRTSAPTSAPSGAAAIDLASMTPEDAAERLFSRVMSAAESGDTTEARTFAPMAIQAYDRVAVVDSDVRYHLGLLHLLLDQPDQARVHADAILEEEPNHLFGLFVAAQSAREAGAAEEARGFYQHFLDAYPNEIARDLPEYQAHVRAFPGMRAEAQQQTR